MDLALTTSAGRENITLISIIAEDIFRRMLTHKCFYDTETQTENRCPGASTEKAPGCCGTLVMSQSVPYQQVKLQTSHYAEMQI